MVSAYCVIISMCATKSKTSSLMKPSDILFKVMGTYSCTQLTSSESVIARRRLCVRELETSKQIKRK